MFLAKGGGHARLRRGAPVPNPQSPVPAHVRASFTLIELMVVITIIAILATITLGVVGGLLSQAKEAATKSTILKIQGLLNSRAQAFDRLIKRKGYMAGCLEFQQAKQNFPTASPALLNIIATKYLEQKFFPQQISDVNAAFYPKLAAYTDATPAQVFCYMLTETTLGDTPVATDYFSASELSTPVADNTGYVAGGGLPFFKDAWGQPLRFWRWPTRLFRPDGQAGPNSVNPILPAQVATIQSMFSTLPVFTGNLIQDLARDPDDPLQDCLTSISNFESSFHTPATYHVFLVLSAGPDGATGIYEPNDNPVLSDPPASRRYGNLAQLIPGQADALTDNVTAMGIRAGGK